MDAYGAAWSLFFLFIVFMGSFFVLNLVLAVLENSFTTSRDHELAAELRRQLVVRVLLCCGCARLNLFFFSITL